MYLMSQCSQESNVRKMKNLLHHRVSSNNFKGSITGKTENQWNNVLTKFKRGVFVNVDIYMSCLDDFYFKFLKIVSHEVAPILKLLVTLIYDQSWIERGICGQTYNVEKTSWNSTRECQISDSRISNPPIIYRG